MSYTPIKPPFGWIGGKRQLADQIIALMPPHDSYIEVFAGGLAVFFRKNPKPIYAQTPSLFNNKTKQERDELSDDYIEVVNDINGDLINLYRTIRNNRKALTAYLDTFLCSREEFDTAKRHLKNGTYKNNIHRAALFYYTIKYSFGCKQVSYVMYKGGQQVKNIWVDFMPQHRRLQGVSIENMPFDKLIPEYDKPTAFFYCDPPYMGSEKAYKNIGGFGRDEHNKLSKLLKNIKGKFLLSYNDCAEVRELYRDYHIIETDPVRYTLNSDNNNLQKRELIATNYQPPSCP